MRASLSARVGQQKPHETQTPQPEQIIRKLCSAEQLLNQGQPVAYVCRAIGVSVATYKSLTAAVAVAVRRNVVKAT